MTAHAQPTIPSPAKPGRINWTMPTLGGKQLWTDVKHCHQWRIQKNFYTGHFRLLDERDYRRAWGSCEHCLAELHRQSQQLPPMQGKAAVLLHGLLRSRSSMRPLAAHLRENGYHVFNVSYASSRHDLSEHAAALRQIVEGLVGIDRIDFIGHSMGNLVVRQYLSDAQRSDAGVDPRIHRVVMIAPPNQGSQFARAFKDWRIFQTVWGESAMQIAEWQSLEVPLADPPCEFGIIAGGLEQSRFTNPFLDGNDDLVVTVKETRLKGARDFIVVPALHSLILNSAQTHELALRFLEDGHFLSEDKRCPIE